MKLTILFFFFLIISQNSNSATLNTDGLPIESDKKVARVCLEKYAVYRITYRVSSYAFDMSIRGETKDPHGFPKVISIDRHTQVCNIKPNQIQSYKEIEANKVAMIAKKKEAQEARNKLDSLCLSEFEDFISTEMMDKRFIRGTHKDVVKEASVLLGNVLDVSVYWNYDGETLNDKEMRVTVNCSPDGTYTSHKLSEKDLVIEKKIKLRRETKAKKEKAKIKSGELKAKFSLFMNKHKKEIHDCVRADSDRLKRSLKEQGKGPFHSLKNKRLRTVDFADKYILVNYEYEAYDLRKSPRGKHENYSIMKDKAKCLINDIDFKMLYKK